MLTRDLFAVANIVFHLLPSSSNSLNANAFTQTTFSCLNFIANAPWYYL